MKCHSLFSGKKKISCKFYCKSLALSSCPLLKSKNEVEIGIILKGNNSDMKIFTSFLYLWEQVLSP